MKLLYVWVENYKCFKNQGFNFSSKHKFDYDQNNKILKYEENKNYIEGLFNYSDYGSNSNKFGVTEVTAIVGNNGSGKSSLLDLIINISDTLPYYKSNYLIVLLDEFDKICIISEIDEIDIPNVDGHEINYSADIRDLNKLNFIYHSNALEYQYYKANNYMNVHNISTVGLMRDDYNRLHDMGIITLTDNNNVIFFNEELHRQIKFVYEFKYISEYIDFEIPNKLNASFNEIIQIKDTLYKRIYKEYSRDKFKFIIENLDENEDIRKTLTRNLLKVESKFQSINLKTDLDQFKKKLLEGIYINILYSIIPDTVSSYNNNQYSVINDILEKNVIIKIDSINYIEELWNLIYIFIDFLKIDNLKIIKSELDEYKKSLNIFKDNIDINFLNKIEYIHGINYFRFDIDDSLNEEELYKLKRFYSVYVNTVSYFNYIQFSWDMSNGENNLLSLFSRFHSLIDKKTGNIKNNYNGYDMDDLIILMDEADMSFHPEWQRKYISVITKFLKKIFKENMVHLIITTHSPIMLSDIPSDNIIYLRKACNISDKNNINNRTFGANIYNLYKDKFFFEDQYKNDYSKHFGIIGEFACKKIEYVIEILDKYIYKQDKLICTNKKKKIEEYKDLNECRKIINLIGETFIRDMLDNKYERVKSILNIEDDYKLNQSIEKFNKLSEDDKQNFIKYIIDLYRS